MAAPILRTVRKSHSIFRKLGFGSVFDAGSGVQIKTGQNRVLPRGTIPQIDPQQAFGPAPNASVTEVDAGLGEFAPIPYGLDQGNDPVLGPPFAPVLYRAYLYDSRTGQGERAPGVGLPPANTTRISWTVPDILVSGSVSDTPPNTEVTVTINNYANFPAKTTRNIYWKLPAGSGYVVADTATNNTSASSGATTAAMANNGDNTSTVTLSGGSYVFTPSASTHVDAGAVLHWNDGTEVIIVSVTNATTAIVDGGATKAAQQFTMYEVGPMAPVVLDGGVVAPNYGFIVPIYVTFTATVNGAARTITSNVLGSIRIGVA